MLARVAAACTIVAVLTACTSGGVSPDDRAWPGQPGELVLASALVAFDACDELLDYVIDHALEMVGPWGLGGPGTVVDVAAEDAGVEEAADAGQRAAAPVEGVDYSGTNVQEVGVDEPDNVKTDGRRMFLVRGQWLHVVEAEAGEPQLLSTVRLDGWGSQLLLAGDRLLVLGEAEGGIIPMERSVAPWTSGTRLQLYDVADPAGPELVSTLDLDGWVVSARLVDGVARVVVRAEPVGLPFVAPEGSGIRAEREATERNREIVRNSTTDNWVPYFVLRDARGGEREGILLPCEQLHHPDEFAGLGTATVLSLDLAGDLSPHGGSGVLAGAETVYASSERLYVATNRWIDWDALSEGDARQARDRYATDLHAFDITDPDAARYVGSGSVRGHVLNQWAMSVHDEVLRVATTAGAPWWGGEPGGEQPSSESFVTTFAERDGGLVELGRVGGLGRDERIYAVRFLGEVGYVVTFRETDPLYTLDLSDPADPRVLGELKILGYSAYLHPIDESLILGVGQDADERGTTRGLQLSLFDVSDLAEPRRLHQVTLPDAHSGVEWDHHAFLHWPATGLTVIPYETWRWVDERDSEDVDSGALAYALDRETGFSELGRLTHLTAEVSGTNPSGEMAWRAPISRSLVVGDALYTVSDLGIKASDLTSLADRGWLALPAGAK